MNNQSLEIPSSNQQNSNMIEEIDTKSIFQGWKEQFLSMILPSQSNIFPILYPNPSLTPKTSKETIPKFNYSELFTYDKTIYLCKVSENILKINSYDFIYNSGLPIENKNFDYETNLPNITNSIQFNFPVNISGNLLFGFSANYPYIIVPSIYGQIYFIVLNIEQILINGIINGEILELDTNNSYLLSINNINNLMDNHEIPLDFLLIASLSKSYLAYYELSIVKEFLQMPMNPDTLLKPKHTINISDYYLTSVFGVKEQENTICTQYISNCLFVLINKWSIFKIIDVKYKKTLFSLPLDQNRQFQSQNLKLMHLNYNPFLSNTSTKMNFLILIGLINDIDNSFLKLFNISCKMKKNNVYKDLEELPFDVEFTEIEVSNILNFNLKNHNIVDFQINSEGIWIAEKNKISLLEFKDDKNNIDCFNEIISWDQKIFIFENEDKNIEDIDQIIDRIISTDRFPINFLRTELQKTLNCEFNENNYLFIREKIKNYLKNEIELNELKKILKDLTNKIKKENQILSIFFTKNFNLMYILRNSTLNCLIQTELYENLAYELKINSLKKTKSMSKFYSITKENSKKYDISGFKLFFTISSLLKKRFKFSANKIFYLYKNSTMTFQELIDSLIDSRMFKINENDYEFIEDILDKNGLNDNNLSLEQFICNTINLFDFKGIENEKFKPAYENNDWSSILYDFLALNTQESIIMNGELALDLLVLCKFFERNQERFDFFLFLKNRENLKEFYWNVNLFSKISCLLISTYYCLKTNFSDFDSLKNENIKKLLDNSQFANYSHLIITEKIRKIIEPYNFKLKLDSNLLNLLIHDTYKCLLGTNPIEFIISPKILEFTIENKYYKDFILFYSYFKIKNHETIYQKARALLSLDPLSNITEISECFNFLAIYENLKNDGIKIKSIDYKPLYNSSVKECSKIEKLFLHFLFLFNENSRSKYVISQIALTTIIKFISKINQIIFLKEIFFYHLDQKNYSDALNFLSKGFSLDQEFANERDFLVEFYENGNIKKILNMSFDETVFKNLKSYIHKKGIHCFNEFNTHLIDKNNYILEELNLMQLNLFNTYKEKIDYFTILYQLLIEKYNYTEAAFIMSNYLSEFLNLFCTKNILFTKELFMNLINFQESLLMNIIFALELAKKYNKNSFSVLNLDYFNNIHIEKLENIDEIETETEEKKNLYYFVSKTRRNNDINREEQINFEINDFKKLQSKLKMIKIIITNPIFSENYQNFNMETSCETILNTLVKLNEFQYGLEFTIDCDLNATHFIIYLVELIFRNSNNRKNQLEYIEIIEKIINRANLDDKKNYLINFGEKFFRKQIGSRIDFDYPDKILKIFEEFSPLALISLYLKYRKLEKAGAIVLNSIKRNRVIGNEYNSRNLQIFFRPIEKEIKIEKEYQINFLPIEGVLIVLKQLDIKIKNERNEQLCNNNFVVIRNKILNLLNN